MKSLHYLLWFFIVIFTNCSSTKDYIIKEKDFIPEGTAYNTNTNEIYIGSIYKQKVVSISSQGEIKDIITTSQFENLSPLGMEMDNDNNILWVCAAAAPIIRKSNVIDWKTAIIAFDVSKKSIIQKYDLTVGKKGTFLNDITISSRGDIYVTDSVNNRVYKVNHITNQMELFIDLGGFTFPNGITFHKPSNNLFVAVDQGILKIKIETKQISLIETSTNINTKVIDGLSVYKNYFIGHQHSKVSKFYFNKTISKIEKVEILDDGEEFDSTTTGEVFNDYYFFIVNSQLQSGIDRTGTYPIVKPLDSLENIIIRKRKL